MTRKIGADWSRTLDVTVLGRRVAATISLGFDGHWSTVCKFADGSSDYEAHYAFALGLFRVPGYLPAVRLFLGPVLLTVSTERVES